MSPEKHVGFESTNVEPLYPYLSFFFQHKRGNPVLFPFPRGPGTLQNRNQWGLEFLLSLLETWGPEAEKSAATEVYATCYRVP